MDFSGSSKGPQPSTPLVEVRTGCSGHIWRSLYISRMQDRGASPKPFGLYPSYTQSQFLCIRTRINTLNDLILYL